MRISTVALCLALAATACIPDATKTEITNVRHDAQTGSVGGLVFDFVAGTPLAGVTVTLYTGKGPLTAMTDAQGYYAFPTVPVGAFSVIITQTGYGPAVLTGTLNSVANGEAVNGPQTTLNPVGLITMNGSFAVRVVDDSGLPVQGAALSASIEAQFVEWNAAGGVNGTGPVARGSFVVTATSGADGTATFSGLPPFAKIRNILDSTIQVNVAPIFITGSTLSYSFLGETFNVDVLNLSSKEGADFPTITLSNPNAQLKIEASSIDYLEDATNGGFTNIKGVIGATVSGPITIQFNNAINSDTKTIAVQVLELQEGLSLSGTPNKQDLLKPSAVSFTPAVNGNILTLTPASAPVAGKSYWMTLTVQSAQKPGLQARVFSTTFPFWGPLNTDVQVSGAKQLDRSCTPTNINDVRPTDTVTFLFNEPIGRGQSGAAGPPRFDCVVYFVGAEFNGSASILGSGEIDGSGNKICDPDVQGNRGRIEMVPPATIPDGAVQTGFSSKWRFVASDAEFYECDKSITSGCPSSTSWTRPGAGMHKLNFQFLTGGDVIRRLNGTPVGEITIELPSSPSNNPAPANCL